MKHPHFDIIMEWANDTSLVVEVLEFGQWSVTEEPRWCVDKKYRFKRETPTDLVYLFDINCCGNSWPGSTTPNIRMTFDGKTRKLKKAEVLK